jgi:hypothetical protein
MSAINEPNESFEFKNLQLLTPVAVSGGHHFIRYLYGENPLYLQPPKCKIKQGIVKAGKRMYCDLMFTNENEKFIQWIENLDNMSQKTIFSNRSKWFESDLEEHDIENSFTSPMKVYKSGKYYIVRVNIPAVLGKPNLKIYDDIENLVDIESIKENDNVATILEFQGIKCSPRSFQIEIEMKQLLVLKPVDLFEKCLFKINTKAPQVKEPELPQVQVKEPELPQEPEHEPELPQEPEPEPDIQEPELPQVKEPEPKLSQAPELKSFDEMEEIELPLEEISTDDSVFIKQRNDVYYEMYRDAIKKAKTAKNIALASYLEAKRIKNTYMLTDLSDEDSDVDE